MIPVIALTGPLGAGKTSTLNHLLSRPGARIGVVINDFGAINVDAALIAGRVDEAESITGGCVCCLPDAGGLDDALDRLTHPRLRLDAVIVESSGVADPLTVARLIRFNGAEHARPGGVIDVVDASAPDPLPGRFTATTLVVVNKLDLLPDAERGPFCDRITEQVRQTNPRTPVVPARLGRIDPALVYDTALAEDPADQLPIAALIRDTHAHDHAAHDTACAVTVPAPWPVDAAALIALLEGPPPGAYRVKGRVAVRTPRGRRHYLVNLVGRHIHVQSSTPGEDLGLVAIGIDLDPDGARPAIEAALAPADRPEAAGLHRLQRYRRLSA